jgi:hypothetical protein
MPSQNGEASAINGNNDKVQQVNETFNINQQQISQQAFQGGNGGWNEARNSFQNTSGGCLPECSIGQGGQGCEGQGNSSPLSGMGNPLAMLEGGLPGMGGGQGGSPFGSNPLSQLFGGGGGSDSSSSGSSSSGINIGEVAGIVAAVC